MEVLALSIIHSTKKKPDHTWRYCEGKPEQYPQLPKSWVEQSVCLQVFNTSKLTLTAYPETSSIAKVIINKPTRRKAINKPTCRRDSPRILYRRILTYWDWLWIDSQLVMGWFDSSGASLSSLYRGNEGNAGFSLVQRSLRNLSIRVPLRSWTCANRALLTSTGTGLVHPRFWLIV